LQDSYKDVTEWYASRTTVNDASSFRVLAISLLVLVSVTDWGSYQNVASSSQVLKY
jgi:hypothetical protein